MKLPNKVTNYKQSVVSKFPLILNELKARGECDVYLLYKFVRTKTENVAEFLDILDCLFALSKIGFNEGKRSIFYVA